MIEWKEFKLIELVEKDRGISYGIVQPGEFQKHGGVPILKVNNLTESKTSLADIYRVSEDVESKYSKTRLKGNEILVSVVGTLGHLYKVKPENVGWNIVRAIASLPIKKEVDRDWIYYCLKNPQLQNELIQRAMHTVQATLNLKELKEITLKLPPLPTQKAIAEILSSLDDKIELNNQINQNLETLAQALFKQWFVDFEFPNENGEPYKSSGGEMIDSELGEIPKGWEAHPIGDLFEFVVGGDWGNDFIDEEHTEKCYVIRGTDIPQLRNGSIGNTPIRFIKEKKAISRFLKPGDLVIEISGGSKDQPTGRTILITRELLDRLDNSAIPASFCRLIRPKQGFSEFLGVYFDKIYSEGKTWEYQNQSTGIANFQFKYFEEKEVLALPNDPLIIEAFNELVDPIISTISSNENLDLVKLRDTLLPKLISGELEVSEVSIEPTF